MTKETFELWTLSFRKWHNQNFPLNLPPIPGSIFYYTYLTRDSTAQCVCSPGAGFNPPSPEFLSPCGLPVSCCLAVSVVRSHNSEWLVVPPRVYVCICMESAGPAWSSLVQDLYGSGRYESGICMSPSPGPWLDSTVWTLVFGWPQLGLISPLRFPSWSRYILGLGIELNNLN